MEAIKIRRETIPPLKILKVLTQNHLIL